MLNLKGALLDLAIGIVRRSLDALMPDGEAFAVIEDPKALQIAEVLCERFDANIRVKDIGAMRVALAGFDLAHFLGAGVPTSTEFLTRFATTIGAEIFVPREMLRGDGKRLIAVLAHEFEHVLQFKKDGFIMPWMYINSTEERAGYEANAYGAGEDVERAMGWPAPVKVDDVAPSLVASYHLQPADVSLATDMLRSHLASIEHGVHVSTVAPVVIEAIKSYAPEWIVR